MSKTNCPGSSILTDDGKACEVKLDFPLYCGLTWLTILYIVMRVDEKQIKQVMSLMTPERLLRLNTLQRKELDKLIKHLESSVIREKGQENFLDFCASVWSEFICGAHHTKMAQAFERVAEIFRTSPADTGLD